VSAKVTRLFFSLEAAKRRGTLSFMTVLLLHNGSKLGMMHADVYRDGIVL
jgi:hypothetical protein